jgi:hypothetical protein
MKKILVIGLWTLVTLDIQGQVVGKIFINGQEFLNSTTDQKYFDFKPLTAKLSKKGKRYLDSFANYCSTNLGKIDSLKIVIDPALTLKEMKVVNSHIGLTRAWTAHDYLKNKYGIEIPKAIVRESYTACVLTGTIKRRQGRENKKNEVATTANKTPTLFSQRRLREE